MLAIVAITGLVLIGLLMWFYRLEVTDRRHTILVVLVVVLLVESLLAGPAAQVPEGLLRPQIGGQDFRPPDAVIFAALGARMLGLRRQRVSPLALAWGAFLTLYLTGVVVGFMNGLPSTDVLFQGKAIFYLVGGAVIASGADVDRIAASVSRLGVVLAAIVPVAVLLQAAAVSFTLSTPVQRFNQVGRLSNDTITLLTLIGVVVILVEAVRPRRRMGVMLAGLVLLLSPVAGQQRASYLVLAGVLVMFALLVLGPTWKRRCSLTGVEMALMGMGLAGVVAAGLLITSPSLITAPVQDAFGGEAEVTSAFARFGLVDQAIALIEERPLTGWGMGIKVAGVDLEGRDAVPVVAHNVVLDIGMRVGLVGVLLFVIAVWMTVAAGLRLWRRALDNATAAIAAASVLVLGGVLIKGMVEPALDKFRLSLAVGIAIGLIIAAQRRDDVDQEAAAAGQREPAAVP